MSFTSFVSFLLPSSLLPNQTKSNRNDTLNKNKPKEWLCLMQYNSFQRVSSNLQILDVSSEIRMKGYNGHLKKPSAICNRGSDI